MELNKSQFLILLCLNVFVFAAKLESEFSRVRMADNFYCAQASVSTILQYLGTPIDLEVNQTVTQQLLALEIIDEDSFMHKIRDILNFYTTDLNLIPHPYVFFPFKLKSFTSYTEIFFSLVENSLSRNAPVILGFNGNLPSYHSACNVKVIIAAQFDESNPTNSTFRFMDPWTSQFGVFRGGHLQNLLQENSFLLLNIAKSDVIKGRNVQEEICTEELKVSTNFNFCNPTQIFKYKRQTMMVVNDCIPTDDNPVYDSHDNFIVHCHPLGRDTIILKMGQISVQALMKIVSERTKHEIRPYFMNYLSVIHQSDETCIFGHISDEDHENMFNLIYYGNAYIRDLLDKHGSKPSYPGYFCILGYRNNELKDLDPDKSFYVE